MNKSIKLRLIVMNLIQWAVWGSYLTSMGSYLASVGLATRIGIFYSMQGTNFTYETERMELIGKDEPCLILMNHSCFLDMEIASTVLYPRPYNIHAYNRTFKLCSIQHS